MTKPTLRLAGIHYRGDPPPTWPLAAYADLPVGADGVAVYALEDKTGNWEDGLPMRQHFRQGSSATINGVIIWGWDGNREAPTLEPSYAWNKDAMNPQWPYVHLYLRKGRIEEDSGNVQVNQ
jgi:hypothetical protein